MLKRVTGLRGLFVGNDQSLAERMRRRRWSLVTQLVPRLQMLSVLDLGAPHVSGPALRSGHGTSP